MSEALNASGRMAVQLYPAVASPPQPSRLLTNSPEEGEGGHRKHLLFSPEQTALALLIHCEKVWGIQFLCSTVHSLWKLRWAKGYFVMMCFLRRPGELFTHLHPYDKKSTGARGGSVG